MATEETAYTFRTPTTSPMKFRGQPKFDVQPPFRAAPHLTQYRTFEREEEQGQEPDVSWPVNNSLWDRTRELEAEVTQLRALVADLHEQLANYSGNQAQEATPAPPQPVRKTAAERRLASQRSIPTYVRVIDLD